MATTMNMNAELSAALWVECLPAADGGGGSIQVRHPACLSSVAVDTEADPDGAVQREAMTYLKQLAEQVLQLVPVVQALQDPESDFAWLPIAWGLGADLPEDANPVRSFLVTRGSAEDWTEASLVLLAARQLRGKAVGDGIGLRVTAHVSREKGSKVWNLRFASVNGSRLDEANVRLPPWLKAACQPERARAVRQVLAEALRAEHPAVHAVEVHSEADQVCRAHGVAVRFPLRPRQQGGRAQVLGYEVLFDVRSASVLSCKLTPLSAQMAELRLFERDPASQGPPDTLDERRPSRAAGSLDELREFRTEIPRAWRGDRPTLLKEPHGLFEVTHEGRRDLGKPGAATVGDASKKTAALPSRIRSEPVAAEKLPLRSDDLAAAQSYLRAKQLFDRLSIYGFNTRHYFRHARLPLELRARARLNGAVDGRTINAEVRPFYRNTVPEVDLLSNAGTATVFDDGQRPQLLVRLGSADSKVRRGEQALGLAADPRWMWHEFGHVLSFAATGELEFAFAHSAGDALAAITADPDSELAVNEALRGVTFPWAFVPRRHDRQAQQGYCWCGERVRLGRRGASMNHHRHGYFEEQLLSSSLFRLYRSLGGATGADRTPGQPGPDSAEDLKTRWSASDYCVYLIMRAIALLGPNGVVPTLSVDQFVGALIDADMGTGSWEIQPLWPESAPRRGTVKRTGGRVHKVIRWCFEQQGLYADETPGAVAEGPGLPPAGDVFIADRREGPAGGYTPVPLRWDDAGCGAWHAHPDAIRLRPDGVLVVAAAKHSGRVAHDVSMRVWVSRDAGERAAWEERKAVKSGELEFEARLDPPKAPGVWVLAAVHSAGDPSNLSDAAALQGDRASLMELVASDNNLALAYIHLRD
jgi:hypothetical protein